MNWPRFVKLNKEFNRELLKQEVADIASDGWKRQTPFFADNVPGINTTVYHDGGWSVLSLRSLGGDNDRTDPGGPNFRDYAYTDYLDKAPYLRSILAEFGGAIRTVRLSRMEANQSINYHADTFIGFQYGQLRLHIPITTNEYVKMYVDDEESYWGEGELWFADFARRHKVDNLSDEARVHLIIDVYLTDYVLSLFPEHVRAELNPEQLLMHQEAISLTPEVLSSYECQFKVSAALIKGIFETDDGIDGEYLGRVGLDENNELLFSLADKPLFHIEPIEVGLFKLKSWAMERTIEFQKNDSGHVEAVKMNFHCAKSTSSVIIPTVK